MNTNASHDMTERVGTVKTTIIVGLLTRRQVAARLGTCPHTIARWTRKGLLPVIRINCRVVRYDPAVVEHFINKAVVS